MQVPIHAAKTNLSKLIEAVERGERVIVTRHNTPVVELVPAKRSKVRFGSLADRVGPPPDEFLEPMSEDELRDWGAM